MFVTIDDPIWSNRNYLRGFPGGTVGKESACNVDVGWIPGSERSPRRKKWQPTAVFLPGKSHGQRSLVGCSSWTTEQLARTCMTIGGNKIRKVRGRENLLKKIYTT